MIHKEEIITKNKAFNIQAGRWTEWSYFSFTAKWTRCQDHAGLTLEVEVLGFYILFNVYDTRHWNTNDNRWMRAGESHHD